jgi:hypothetical protein
VPESLKSRAMQMASLLGADAVRPAANRPTATAPAASPAAPAATTKTGE